MEDINYTAEIDLGLAKILVLANMINRKTELCCFVNDTAHCRYLEIRLYKDVESYAGIPVNFEVRYSNNEHDKDGKERLASINRCVEFLEATLKAKNIQYEMTEAIKKYVTVAYEI